MKRTLFAVLAAGSALVLGICSAQAQITVTLDPSAPWLGYMNVFNLPADGGAYQFGSAWGTADLTATFSGPTLTLGPNTIGDPAGYWYKGGGRPGAQGNKTMEANMYLENNSGAFSGTTITFTAEVLSNTFASSHLAIAFIKDFAPDYSSFNVVTAPLVNGTFSISLETINQPGRHVQYGFTATGPNVWITDTAPIGTVQIAPVPEPASVGVLAGGFIGLLCTRRSRNRRLCPKLLHG